MQKVVWLILHPLCLLTLIVMIYTALSFPDEPILELLEKGIYGILFRKPKRPVCKVKMFIFTVFLLPTQPFCYSGTPIYCSLF